MRSIRDVIVVGAGPSGSACALELARSGHDVLMLERDPRPGSGANCTGILGQEAMAAFAIPDSLAVNTISALRFIGPDDRTVLYRSPTPLASVVRRRRLDASLAQAAVDAGAELRCGTTVDGIDRFADRVEIRVSVSGSSSEGREMIRGRVVVLAMGYRPPLLRSVGLEEPQDFVQAAQLLCPIRETAGNEPWPPEPQTPLVFVGRQHAPGAFAWAVALESGWMKVGVAADSRATHHLARLLEHPALQGRLQPEEGRLRCSPIPVGTARSTTLGRLLVVGEAAGQVKATSHGGIYYGLLGGRLAGQVLGQSLQRDDLSRAGLAAYEEGWRALLGDEIEAGTRFRRRARAITDRHLQALMGLARFPGVVDFVHRHADFDWHHGLLRALERVRLVDIAAGAARSAGRVRDLVSTS